MEEKSLDLEAIESLIRQSMSDAKAQGVKITDGIWGVDYDNGEWQACDMGVCALGSTLLGKSFKGEFGSDKFDGILLHLFADILGVSDGWIASFIDGFDGNDNSHKNGHAEAYHLGRSIRNDWKAGMWS